MGNLWDFIQSLYSIVINVGQKLWTFLTTPIMGLINDNLPSWLSWLTQGLNWFFGDNGLYPNASILVLLPLVIIVVLVIRLIMYMTGRR